MIQKCLLIVWLSLSLSLLKDVCFSTAATGQLPPPHPAALHFTITHGRFTGWRTQKNNLCVNIPIKQQKLCFELTCVHVETPVWVIISFHMNDRRFPALKRSERLRIAGKHNGGESAPPRCPPVTSSGCRLVCAFL